MPGGRVRARPCPPKEKQYDSALTMMRSAGASRAGLRKVTFFALCAFTSLGGLSEQVVKFLNGAAGFLKACETAAALRRFRDVGLTPQLLSKRLRFRARALLQAAILQGFGSIAYSVGLYVVPVCLSVSVLLLCISLNAIPICNDLLLSLIKVLFPLKTFRVLLFHFAPNY
jgi:hypothetical protein